MIIPDLVNDRRWSTSQLARQNPSLLYIFASSHYLQPESAAPWRCIEFSSYLRGNFSPVQRRCHEPLLAGGNTRPLQ